MSLELADQIRSALVAGLVDMTSADGETIEAYVASPADDHPKGSVVVIHHLPGWDEATREIVRKFAYHGYRAICPNLYYRQAPGAAPDDAAALVRSQGGISDAQLISDVGGAVDFLRSLPDSNGKVGVIGYCSGGRQTFLAACSLKVDAAIDCYGAFVLGTPPSSFPLKVGPLDHIAKDLSCELLGLFGAEDSFPAPDETAKLSELLDGLGKTHEFVTYENAGHAFFATDRPSYRVEAANEGWQKIWGFFGRKLS